MRLRMSVARCCCAIVAVGCLTCNVVGTVYAAALALVDFTCTPFSDETNWTDIPFNVGSQDLVDNATVVCNSVGKANANVAGNYWEAFSSSNGFSGVVSSTCRPNYNATEAAYPNEWDVCANNTVEGLFTLGIIADQASMPTTGGYDDFPEVSWTATVLQGGVTTNSVTSVTLTTTMDRDANTYSSKVTVTELTRDDDQLGGSTSSTVATDYTLASTASSHSGSVKFKVTPITPTYTDVDHGLVDKWKLEYTVVIGGVSVTIPDFEFTQLVRDSSNNSIGLNPFEFQQGARYSSTYFRTHFKVRYTDVSAVLSHTAPYTGDSVPLCDPALTYLANNHAWNISEHDYSTMPAIPLPLTAGTSQISPVGASVPEDYTCSVRLVTGSNPPATINPTSTGDSEGGRLEAYATVSSFTRTADQYYNVDINQDLVTYPNRSGLMSAPKSSFGSTLRYFFTLSGAKDPTYGVYPEFGIGAGTLFFEYIGINWHLSAPFATVTQHISPWPSESTSDFEVEITSSTVNVYITDSVYTRELMASTSTAYTRKGAYNSQILQHRTNFIDLSGLDYHIDGGVVTNKTLGSWTLSDGDWSESAGTISMDNSGKSASVGGTYEPDERYFAHQTVTLASNTLHRISWDTSGTDYDAIPAVAIDDVCISELADGTHGKSAIDRLSESYFFKTDGSGSAKVAFYQYSQKNADISNIKIEELT